jgi:hypothetical protein
MSTLANLHAKHVQLAGLKTELDGGNLYYFAGPVPDESDDALDMVAQHTEVVKFSLNGAGVTGLTFAAPAAGVLAKNPAEVWQGPVAFDGAQQGAPSLMPTFARFCAAGDNGRGAGGASARLQFRVGGPASDAEIRLGVDGLVDNGSNTQALDSFTYGLASLG